MYKFSYYTEQDDEKVIDFMKQNAFALITGFGEKYPVTTQIPLAVKVTDGKIFLEGHKLEPYYASAYGLYRLDWLFRNESTRFASKYKPARFHVLLAARLLINKADLPRITALG